MKKTTTKDLAVQPAATQVGPNDDGSITIRWAGPRQEGRPFEYDQGSVQVWFDSADPQRVASVRVTLPGGLTPTRLQRFPWARVLRVADAGSRALAGDYPLEALVNGPPGDILDAAFGESWPESGTTAPRRPGRPKRPDEFYFYLASLVDHLRAQGIANPDKFIADMQNVSETTVRGWRVTARKLGYLKSGRPGRPPSGQINDQSAPPP